MAASDTGYLSAAVREKADGAGNDAAAEALGFPSPFVAVNLSDKNGVWQGDPALVKQLGEDPSKHQRRLHTLSCGSTGRSAVAPAGLRNLSATCYMNSLFQSLFFNADFRHCLLRADASSKAVQAMQRIFANMLASRRNVIDPSEFVKVAELDADEEQDVQEFSALLLDLLERELGGSDKLSGGGFIPTLFQGVTSRRITCLEHPDHTFERREPFLELRARLTLTSGAAPAPAATPGANAKTAGVRRGASTQSLAGRTAPPPPPASVVEPPQTAQAAAQASAAASASSSAAKRGSGNKKKAPPLVRLEELLTETAFPDEMLTGSDKYDCEKCGKKVDARASVRLAQPPPYLHVTIERYHYDLSQGERKKLNNPVSFPQHLSLRSCAQGGKGESVSYDCIGFLEHVSDSADSGHYTATLWQAEEDAAEALAVAGPACSRNPAEGEVDVGAEAGADNTRPMEPAPKRPRCESADAAAASPRQGLWWMLDDDKISPVEWQGAKAAKSEAEGGSAAVGVPPERIESASAYMVLYRRRGYVHEGHGEHGLARQLPAQLSAVVAAENKAFVEEQQSFLARASAVDRFLRERRLAVKHLVQALRDCPSSPGSMEVDTLSLSEKVPAWSVVPTSWLSKLLSGEDRSIRELLAGGIRPSPVMYGRTLLRSPAEEQGLILDPLAVWCGEVKFLPTAAFEELGGLGGLDSSLFLELKDSVGDDVCKTARTLYKCFEAEWLQIRKILTEGKVTSAEARTWVGEERADEAVWLSLKVQKLWQKAIDANGATKGQSWQLLALKAFFKEVREARWLGHTVAEEPSPEDALAENPPSCGSAGPVAQADAGEVDLTAGIVCEHGLVCNTRASVLARRADVEKLLELASAKEQAYLELWRHAPRVPRMRAGSGDELLSFGETCSICGAGGKTTAAAEQRVLTVKRWYPSTKVKRKQGNLPVGEAMTGSALRELVHKQFKCPVLRMFADVNGTEVELQNGEMLDESVTCIVVERDENVSSRESSAFQDSIFRKGTAQPSS